MKKSPIVPAALIVFTMLSMLSGSCSVNIADGIPPEAYGTGTPPVFTEALPEVTEDTSGSETDNDIVTVEDENISGTLSLNEETTQPAEYAEGQEYYPSSFSEEYNNIISRCVFVGDSICRGLAAYDIIPSSRVVAQGNIAARNIYDFTFKIDGDEMSVLPALVNLKPEIIVFSMGMNDVNITSEEAFCENYGKLLSETESFLPQSRLVVFSVTPVLNESNFTSNSNIDSFNAALKDYLDQSGKWLYVDISEVLKNPENGLKQVYDGGDGIHLSPGAYYAWLYKLCEAIEAQEW